MKQILVSITGDRDYHYKRKIAEINQKSISNIALFLEKFSFKHRQTIYQRLENSSVQEIPLVHLRHDMKKEEITFLERRYNSKYFTIHEDHFNILSEWEGFEDKLFLEMSTDNKVAENVKVEKIGGFCVDLAHYRKQKDIHSLADYQYIDDRKNQKTLFKCNHLSGYSFSQKMDLHYVSHKKEFNYLIDLPSFLFGDIIAMEINNSIQDQIYYREVALAILKNRNLL